jgi:SRSO17 transposase
MVRYGDISLPIAYEIVKKEIHYCDLKTKKERRRSAITKNELLREIIKQACVNNVLFTYVLADNWYSSKENMDFIHYDLKKYFILGIKSNRTVALSKTDAKNGLHQSLKSLELTEDVAYTAWLKGLTFPVQLIKKIFKNEDGSEGILYLVSNDLHSDANHLYEVYQKRWRIEEFHKSVKQNASLAKSPTKKVRSQCNHVFASMIAYCKLEFLKIKTHLNHFAIKYKLIVRANQIAMQELQIMNS